MMAMQYFSFQNRPLSRIAMGTDHFGEHITASLSMEELDYYTQHGGNLIDTAHMYGQEKIGGISSSEETIGTWLKQRGERESLFIATKGCCPPPSDFSQSRIDEKNLLLDVQQSLDSLDTVPDIWFFHRDNPDMGVDEIIDMANALIIQKGYAHNIGASNWTSERIAAANNWARKKGKTGFTMSEVQASLAESTPDMWGDNTIVSMTEKDRAWYHDQEMPVLAFASQAKGYYSKLLSGEGLSPKAISRFDTPENRKKAPIVERIAKEHAVSPSAVALAYLLGVEGTIVPIIGSSRLSQITDSLSSADFRLTSKELESLH